MLYLDQNASSYSPASAPPLQWRARLPQPRRLAYLSDAALPAVVSPQDAANQVVSQAQFTGAKMTQTEMDAIIQTASTGQLPFGPADWAAQFNCSGVSNPGAAQLAIAGANIGVTVGTGIAAGFGVGMTILGPIGAAAAGIIGLFSAILQHHQQAMKQEENVLCSVVPALNNSLQAVQTAVANGTITPAAASATLDNVVQQFTAAVQSIIKNDNSHCNAACVWVKCLQAYVIVAKSQFAQMTAQAAASPASSITNAAGQAVQQISAGLSTIPGWVLLLLGGGILLLSEE